MRLSFQACVIGCTLALAACASESPTTNGGPRYYPDGGLIPTGDGGPGGPGGGDGDIDWWDWDSGIPPGQGAPLTDDPFHVDRTDMSGLDQGTIDKLKAGGPNCSVQIVYPYNNTAFPGGLLPPPIMWTGGGEAAYVKMEYGGSTVLDYQFATKSSGEITVPVQDWYEITRRTQGVSLKITLNVKKGNEISSCVQNWQIARGNMVGTVYYNTYNHPDTAGTGAVMRLTLGAKDAQVYLKSALGAAPIGPCTSCHSASFDGSTLMATEHTYAPVAASFSASSFRVGATASPLSGMADATFGALTPDGSLLLQMGNPQCTTGAVTFPRAPKNFMLLQGPVQAGLLNTSNGQPVQAKGLNKDFYMWMPQFSPDGKKVVFNHAKPMNPGDPNSLTDRRELAVMDFDQATRTFSNLRVIASKLGAEPSQDYHPAGGIGELVGGIAGSCEPALSLGFPFPSPPEAYGAIPKGACDGPCYPAWPFFTPDGNGVIFSLISEPDFAVAFPGRDKPSKSELWYTDLTTGETVRLDNANKALQGESTQINYYPTVLPVQVGGYYWVVFTSTRKWGTRSTEPPPGAVVDEAVFGPSAREAYKKRLWVSAIKPRLGADGEFSQEKLEDPSLPPFYLEGQSQTGNIRAFAALNPCRPKGDECTSGLDCCTGYCNMEPGETKGTCGEKVMCAQVNERCTVDEDCCPPTGDEPQNYCVGGYCGFVLL